MRSEDLGEASKAHLLIVDDDRAIRRVLRVLLERHGFEAADVGSVEEAEALLERQPFDAVLSDVRLPGRDGLSLVERTRRSHPDLPVVLMTAHGSVALAVDAMKRGAADFIQKPFEQEELVFVLGKALAGSRRERSRAPSSDVVDDAFVADTPAMREVLSLVTKVAPTTSTVLVRGETGTGKERVARAIHAASPRRNEPFVAVNCAALPEALLESELFGYERGAFTGAVQRKAGRIELAHGGTLFLDEIGDVPSSVQVKLLRFLQERELERVGGTQTLRVDVRIVAATHRDLEARMARGEFREDFFYRLAVVPITVPPLRERAEDIVRIASHYARLFGARCGRPHARFDEAALARLGAHAWPGNVRELQNFVERLVVLSDSDVLDAPAVIRELARLHGGSASPEPWADNDLVSLERTRRGSEREALLAALAQAKNNRTLAARLLDVSRRTLYNKLREHGID